MGGIETCRRRGAGKMCDRGKADNISLRECTTDPYRGGGISVQGFFRRGKFRTSQIFSALEAKGILGLRSPKDPGRRQ